MSSWRTAGGNVGIGTSTLWSYADADNLTIGTASGSNGLTIAGATRSDVFFSDGASQFAGMISYLHTDDSLEITTGGNGYGSVSGIKINSIGNVGIGSTTPWAKLSVTNTGTGPSFIVEDSTSPDTTPFIIDASGNVGIGTSTPGYKLDLYSGSTNSQLHFGSTGFDSGGYLTSVAAHDFFASGGAAFQGSWTAKSTAAGIVGSQSGRIEFYTNSGLTEGNTFTPTERMRITSAGLVGIGTTTPDAALTIDRASQNFTALKLTRSGTSPGSLAIAMSTAGTATFTADAQLVFTTGTSQNTSFIDGATTNLTIQGSTGNVGIATTSPWRALSVTGTVGFDGLTGATGAGSLCLDSNNQVVYNSASDSCLSSTRATKHDINPLLVDALSQVLALQPVSFIYNQGDGRTRFGFIAEDTAAVDPHLVTYDASSTVSGIDDRSIIAILVGAMKELASKVSETAHLVIDMLTVRRVETQELCVDDICVTRDQFAEVFGNQSAAAGAPSNGDGTVFPSATLVVNGNDPAQWPLNQIWNDNLGALFSHDGQSETIYSTTTIDTSVAGTTTIDYWAQVPEAQWLHTTRDVVIPAPANDNDPATTTAEAI